MAAALPATDAATAQLDPQQQRELALALAAEAASRVHDRIAWTAYAILFLVVPAVVVVFRLHMQTWHYYVAGAVGGACALLICAMDFMGSTARDKAEKALRQAAG